MGLELGDWKPRDWCSRLMPTGQGSAVGLVPRTMSRELSEEALPG